MFLSCGCPLCPSASVFSGVTSLSFEKALLLQSGFGCAAWKMSPQPPAKLHLKDNLFLCIRQKSGSCNILPGSSFCMIIPLSGCFSYHQELAR